MRRLEYNALRLPIKHWRKSPKELSEIYRLTIDTVRKRIASGKPLTDPPELRGPKMYNREPLPTKVQEQAQLLREWRR